MKIKYYFKNEDTDICYTKEHFLDEMKENGLTEMEVMEAVPLKSHETEYIWCKAIGEAGDRGYCGRMCKSYSPRNGKSGMCKYQGKFYHHGEKLTLKL